VSETGSGSGGRAAGAPLRIAALAKQVPVPESLRMEGGRLVRSGVAFEMNAYCRRAVSEGVRLARATGGSCTVLTLGPPSAEDVLREAVAWGADDGVHLCDPAFAGSDTLATARALASALTARGPFDLVLVGRNSLDGETGQVGPEVAQLLGLAFASGVRRLDDAGPFLRLELEHDDGFAEAEVDLPAVLSVAERLCEPCKVDPEGRAAVPAERLTRLAASELGRGPWGEAGSPTVVGETRAMVHERAGTVLEGPLPDQVEAAMRLLDARGALTPSGDGAATPRDDGRRPAGGDPTEAAGTPSEGPIAVLVEPGRPEVADELLGAAARLGRIAGVPVHALAVGEPAVERLGGAGADLVVAFTGSAVAEDVAEGVVEYLRAWAPWAFLAPSTAFGREVAGRAAAATGSGLVGDAVELSRRSGLLVAAKPAFSGALVADISCRSATQMATVRPGVLPPAPAAPAVRPVPVERRALTARGRVRVLDERRNDDVEALARAEVVIGVGTAVAPEEYEQLSPLAALLGAELAATRKVTDKGWAPRARQVGITGRAIAPRLYVAVGLSGKFNHMVGVRGAGTILAVNDDRTAPVFGFCDIGLVGDWHELVPLLADALRRRGAVTREGAAVS
jgi:electron transfer flavoprotein alpha subunit